MIDKPGRDEVLDAYDILIRGEAVQLRPALDAVFEAGFRDGVKSMQKQRANAANYELQILSNGAGGKLPHGTEHQ